MKRFEGRTVVVTGASRGLGRAFALAFAAEGAYVFAGYHRRADQAAETLRLVTAAGGAAETLRFDVTRPDEVDAAFARVQAARGGADVLVNNAGTVRDGPAVMMDQEAWREVLAVNLDGAFHCIRAALPPMMHNRRGAIVNVASISGIRASAAQANYSASKGGLIALTRSVAAEVAPKGVRVNAVVPGLIDAGMLQHLDRRVVERRLQMTPLGRLGTAEEVARAVLFLASDEASYIVGQALVVDGGLSG